MIIIKHPIVFSEAIDCHQIIAPQAPPIGPPPGVTTPAWPWLGLFIPVPGELLTGKFTDGSEQGDYYGICLWQHDWGILQLHDTFPASLSMVLIPLGSTRKLQFPAGLVQMKATGGALAPPGSSSATAPAWPCGIMVCQSCHDIAGYSFCAPTGVVFCVPTMILVGFTLGDLAAGVCAMIGDSLRALGTSALGNAIFPSNFLGGLAGALMGTAIQTAWSGIQAGVTAWAPGIAPYLTPGDASQRTAAQIAVNTLISTTPLGMALTGQTPFDFAASSLAGKGPKL